MRKFEFRPRTELKGPSNSTRSLGRIFPIRQEFGRGALSAKGRGDWRAWWRENKPDKNPHRRPVADTGLGRPSAGSTRIRSSLESHPSGLPLAFSAIAESQAASRPLQLFQSFRMPSLGSFSQSNSTTVQIYRFLYDPLRMLAQYLWPRDRHAGQDMEMNVKHLVRVILCLVFVTGCSSLAASSGEITGKFDPADENAAHQAILGKVESAVAAEDFDALNRMEREYLEGRTRTPSGLWKLAIFHTGVQFYLSKGLRADDGCQYRMASFVRKWSAAAPGNPAPAITDAALLLSQAWCYRGRGYANSVPAAAWPKFRKGVADAMAVLERGAASASTDPEYFAVKLKALGAAGVSRSALDDALDEAVSREPDYHRIYFNAAWFYLPQWGGSYSEVEAFARKVAEQAGANEQGGLYARIFWSLEDCGCDIIRRAADRTQLKMSMRNVYNRHPVAWNGRYFADTSCKLGDVDEGRAYLRAMHPEAAGDASLSALFAACDWHAGEARS